MLQTPLIELFSGSLASHVKLKLQVHHFFSFTLVKLILTLTKSHSYSSLLCDKMSLLIFLSITYLTQSVLSAPLVTDNQAPYDLTEFDEVYDQRQNGTENWRLNVDKVVLVWTPPGNLLTAAMLLDPELFENGNGSDLEIEEESKPGTTPSSTSSNSSTELPITAKNNNLANKR